MKWSKQYEKFSCNPVTTPECKAPGFDWGRGVYTDAAFPVSGGASINVYCHGGVPATPDAAECVEGRLYNTRPVCDGKCLTPL